VRGAIERPGPEHCSIACTVEGIRAIERIVSRQVSGARRQVPGLAAFTTFSAGTFVVSRLADRRSRAAPVKSVPATTLVILLVPGRLARCKKQPYC
jgi:hypothetical protein